MNTASRPTFSLFPELTDLEKLFFLITNASVKVVDVMRSEQPSSTLEIYQIFACYSHCCTRKLQKYALREIAFYASLCRVKQLVFFLICRLYAA